MTVLQKRLFNLLLLVSLLTTSLNAQLMDSGDIATVISGLVSGMPDDSGDDYADPTNGERDTWASMLTQLFQGDYPAAAATANTIDYDLTEYSDIPSGHTYYLLTSNNANYWGTYVFNPAYCRELVIQAPHPRKDFNTAKQGIHVFRETESMFFAMAGTHRCNHSDSSNCSGTTKVCGEANPVQYRISDMAHSTTTLFQRTTAELFNTFSDSHFLSLHGFTKLGSDPYVIMSNGTRDTPMPDYISLLAGQLEAEDPILTFEIGHINLNWDRLLGFTNTQGRLINGSNDPCGQSANNSDGRFLHLEQEKSRLRETLAGWDKLANAVLNTFPCAIFPVRWKAFSAIEQGGSVVCQWQTSSELNNAYFEVERSTDGYDWTKFDRVAARGDSEAGDSYTVIDPQPLANTSYYRIRQVDWDNNFSYSSIQTVKREQKVIVYPNPASQYIYLDSASEGIREVRIFNIMGQEFTQQLQVSSNEYGKWALNVSQLPNGWYALQVNGKSFRVLKEHN